MISRITLGYFIFYIERQDSGIEKYIFIFKTLQLSSSLFHKKIDREFLPNALSFLKLQASWLLKLWWQEQPLSWIQIICCCQVMYIGRGWDPPFQAIILYRPRVFFRLLILITMQNTWDFATKSYFLIPILKVYIIRLQSFSSIKEFTTNN